MEKRKKTLKINLKTMILLVSIITILLIVSIIFISSYLKKNKNDSEKIVSEIEENTNFNEDKRYDEIEFIAEDGILGVTIYKDEEKTEFELVNFDGETIYNFGEMEYVKNINQNLILIHKDDLYKVIDTKGNTILEEISDSKPQTITNHEEYKQEIEKYIAFKKDGKHKIIDLKTKEIISNYEYEDVYYEEISDGLLKVKKDGKYGAIDKNGNVIINLEYEDLCCYYFLENMIVAKKDGKCGYIDKNGNVIINFKYDRLGFFSEGLISARKEDKIGFIDKEENIIIDFQYEYIYDNETFNNVSYLWDMPQFKEGVALVFKDNWSFYIDKVGNKAIDFEINSFNAINEDFNNGILIVEKNGKYGILDKNGKLIVDFIYDEIQNSSEQTDLLLAKLGDKWGAIDKNGNIIINFEFDYFNFDTNYDNIIDQYIIVQKNSKYGCIDKEGNTIVEFKYDHLMETANNNLLMATNDGKISFINTIGETIMESKYEEFCFYNINFIAANKLGGNLKLLGAFRKGKNWYVLDIDGNKIGTYQCKSK